MSTRHRMIAAAVAILITGACAPPPADDTVGPNQHFVGLVNGAKTSAQVLVACPGPAVAGRTTHPLAGQTLSVTRVVTGGGYTGSVASSIFTEVDNVIGSAATFAAYDAEQPVPTWLDVPCEGTGSFTFSTCFDVLPCSATAEPDSVTVTFVNIAV